MLLGVVEELEDIISNNHTGLAAEDIESTHDGDYLLILRLFVK